MGSVYALSPYERDHIDGIVFVERYAQRHDGALPDIPWIDALRHRFDLAAATGHAARFEHWHPNIARWFADRPAPCPPPIVPCPPVDSRPSVVGCDPSPPDPGRLTVPEPPSMVSLAIALCLALIVRRRLA